MADHDLARRARELAATGDAMGAEGQARAIGDVLLRCRCLAELAEAASSRALGERFVTIAFAAADQADSPNRVLVAASFPLRVLDGWGEGERVAAQVERLLTIIAREPHPVRRMDALVMLSNAVRTEPAASSLEERLLATTLKAHGWKRDALLAGRALAAADAGEPARAREFFAAIELPRTKRVTARRLSERGVDVGRGE